ncbi:ImmA/IrrE family metallo-endopeptidase [Pseudoflavonifractor capillosus]|uniref:ImmA/IrrE family metallo-endopeptidase n=1 Tax=Pseudoflavonifractor capillosus TaxID=106588 RepID=UPI0023F9F6AC|nr:ImmA/IrrE family metallo-endopeptidase [Pseudoflavonifractor capillosus]MDY4662455.1 ImmA/IrrE family metallo-endopeptidase [Pseudoflavonifractor capillosus]
MNKVSFSKICKDYGIRLHSFRSAEKYMKMVNLDPSKTSGYAVYWNNPIILYDDERPIEEIRFTVAHELGHILLGHLSYRQKDGEIPEWAEHEANTFASVLIANEILQQYGKEDFTE